jgi:hypothetical protein
MGLFRRDTPLHEQLAEQAGLDLDAGTGLGNDRAAPLPGPAATEASPGWNEQLPGGRDPDGPGIHGLARSRRWDVVVTADAPGLEGNGVHFVALPDGTLVVDEDEPDDSLAPLADAIEAAVRPPYRAEAVRQGASRWSVAAVRITVIEASGLEGDEAELVTTAESSTLTIDGRAVYGSVPAFERAGEAHGSTYVVRAQRIDGDLWQVEAMPL